MINRFLQYLLSEKRVSGHTYNAYEKDISEFLAFAGINKEYEIAEVNQKLIRGWIADLIREGNSKRTVNRKLSSLRTFYKWAEKEQIISKNPMQLIKNIKNDKRLPEFIKEEEITSYKLNEIFPKNFYGERDRLMIEVFYQTGVRLSELINIKQADIQNQTIRVIGKRNKERIIPISANLEEDILAFVHSEPHKKTKSDYVFITNKGNKLYPKFVYRKVTHYMPLITNLKKKSPHVLRHTFATHMLNNGAELEVLKEILGHSNLSATQVYTHNSFDKLSEIYKQAHPRGS